MLNLISSAKEPQKLKPTLKALYFFHSITTQTQQPMTPLDSSSPLFLNVIITSHQEVDDKLYITLISRYYFTFNYIVLYTFQS